MMWSVSVGAPGPAGFILGGLLIAGGGAALRWLWVTGRRRPAPVTRTVFTPGRVPVPTNPAVHVERATAVTVLLARVTDTPDATQVMPAVREASRG